MDLTADELDLILAGLVTNALERTAQEALAVAETEEDAELARQLLAAARQAQVRRSFRR
jgi:hypothetical protein